MNNSTKFHSFAYPPSVSCLISKWNKHADECLEQQKMNPFSRQYSGSPNA